ncbi:hypothetical protein D3C76_1884750 [compost metagenome]
MVFILGHERTNAGIQAAAHVELASLPGQHHDLGGGLQLLKALDDLHAIQARQADVQYHHIGP